MIQSVHYDSMKHKILLIAITIAMYNLHISASNTDNIDIIKQCNHYIKDFDVSLDGKYIVTCDNSNIALWNLELRKMIKKIQFPTDGKIRFHPTKPEYVYVKQTGKITQIQKTPGFPSINIFTGEQLGFITSEEFGKRNSYHPDYIFKLEDGKIRITARKSKRLIGYLDGYYSAPAGGMSISPNDSLLALGALCPVVWDIKKAQRVKAPDLYNILLNDSSLVFFHPKNVPLPKERYEAGDKNFHYGWRDHSTCWWDKDLNLYMGGYRDSIYVFSMDFNSDTRWKLNNKIYTENYPIYNTARCADQWFTTSYKGLSTGNPATGFRNVDEFIKDAYKITYDITYLKDRNCFITTHDCGHVRIAPAGNPGKSEIIANFGIRSPLSIHACPDNSNVLATGGLGLLCEVSTFKPYNKFYYDTKSLEDVTITDAAFINDNRFATLTRNGDVTFWTYRNPTPHITLNGHEALGRSISMTNNGKFLISSDSQGGISIWNPEKASLIMSAFHINEEDYIFFTPDNFYKASKGASQYIYFSKGMEIFPFEQFDLRLNRPDIVLQRLGAPDNEVELYRNAWRKRIRKMGFKEDSFTEDITLPEAKILNLRDIESVTEKENISLEIEVSDKKLNIDKIFVNLNGVPLLGKNGMDVSHKKSKKIKHNFRFDLCRGSNNIEVFGINSNGTESMRKMIEVQNTKVPEKADMYVVAVGVSKYQSSSFNLNYAAKDASDLAALLQAKCNGSYNKVHTLLLTDNSFDSSSVGRIHDFLLCSKRDDTVVLFYAGHGLLDSDLNYYLGHNMINFENPENNGISYDDFENTLDGIPALKRIIMIDACHSGELDKEDYTIIKNHEQKIKNIKFRNSGIGAMQRMGHGIKETLSLFKELFMDIRWGIGATVISSAGGTELAYEGDQWNNGIFTWCLKNGLNTGDADLNRDSEISANELAKFLCLSVTEHSQGTQQPTMRAQNNHTDFTITRY